MVKQGKPMNSCDAIKNSIQTADMVCGAYLGDLNDEELMQRPHPECNHINWQVGHLIASDFGMINGCIPGLVPELPEGFAERYTKETTSNNDSAAFCSKDELMSISTAQRAAVVAKLDDLTEADLDKLAPESMREYAPTVGAALNMLGGHWMMHAGQWVVVRRNLGREIVI